MKKLFTTLLAAMALLPGYAGVAQTTFRYYDGNLTQAGFTNGGSKETIDQAICINDPSLAGMKITSITAYIAPASPTAVTGTKLWLTSELKLKSRQNDPDIASYDVTVERVQFDDNYYGKLYVELPEPYVLGAEPIYVGSSMTIPALNTDAQIRPILVGQPANVDGFWIHATKNVLNWDNSLAKQGLGSAAIIVGLEGEFPDYCLDVKPVTDAVYVSNNEQFSVTVPVANRGSEFVSEISFSYQIDGGDMQFGIASLPLPLGTSICFSDPVQFRFIPVTGEGKHTITLTVNEINGHPNTSENATISFPINVLGFVPKHMSLVEEFTGLSCTYCARGWLLMERLNENYYNEQVSLIWHKYGSPTTDPMFTNYSLPVYVSGYPKATINRSLITDPYFGPSGNGLHQTVMLDNAQLALMAIDVTAERQGNIITATADVEFIQDLTNNGYKIGFVLAGNNLYSPDFEQSNVYSGLTPGNALLSPGLEPLAELPNPITGIHYNFVVLEASDAMGMNNSLPANIRMRTHYTAKKSFVLDYITQTKYMVDPDDFMVAAFVINPNGTIANAAKYSFVEWPYQDGGSGEVGGITAPEVTTEPEGPSVYYNLQGIPVANPIPGQLYIVNGKKIIF